ncbi:MAG: VCBS repeat-containing protein [Chitinophagaceae bacterium]|nr:VCBS repeat-containing protein [Chitinophagaceae bacterium]
MRKTQAGKSTKILSICFALAAIGISGCKKKPFLFTAVDSSHSHICFENTIEETPQKNVIEYEYYYNGGGVAAADFNNDGLCDLYFTGNASENKLYLNRGHLTFQDVTDSAGMKGRPEWKTGVTVADVNGDGWLDVYVSYSGPVKKEQLYDELYINKGCPKGGIPVFVERAKEYGLDAPFTFSTQSAFFDFDRDGDLDMFQCNHGYKYISPFYNTNKVRNQRHPQFGNRLYRNDGGHFTEISDSAGIHGGGLNFGLSVCISDLNNDGWPDIYVTNDFEEQDFLYLNTGKNSFRDVTKKSTGHLSRFSMGSDIADFNNDLLQDILVVDMLPETLERQKLLKGPDEYDKYTLMADSGFQYQNMRNTLQLNQGNTKDGVPLFSEIGQLAGIYNTDWSWSPLFADLDNDGYKDIFITNGFLRDFTNLDFLKYTYQEAAEKAHQNNKTLPVYDLIKKMPSTQLAHFAFRNNRDFTFTNATQAWGLDRKMISSGAVYADLDNDGDLELITNNTNEKATIWENHTSELLKNNFIKVRLTGKGKNIFAIGAKVFVNTATSQQVQELSPTRGFQSSVDFVLNFGLGKESKGVSVKVIWPDGTVSVRKNVSVDTLIEMNQSVGHVEVDPGQPEKPLLFEDCTVQSGISFRHQENDVVDFKKEPLLPYQISKSGPFLSKGDVNGDNLEDFYLGGSAGYAGELFIQQPDHTFVIAQSQPFDADKACEDMGSVFFDADGDHDLDLYVVSGGNQFETGAGELTDRLYINDGRGHFTKAGPGVIPKEYSSGSCVTTADYDRDGDLDLFVGGKILPGNFPLPGYGGILRNDTDRKTGKLKFTVATADVNPDLKSPGMITDALWADLNNDSWPDLIMTGEWMSVKIFINHQGKLEELHDSTLSNTSGLWSKILAGDFDHDGDTDLVIGNAGLNGQWKPTPSEPMTLYAMDFDDNGSIDPVICTRLRGKDFPIASLDEIADKIPSVRKKFIHYKDYSTTSIDNIFSASQIKKAGKWKLQNLQTCYFENEGNGRFTVHPLPLEAQFSKVNGILSEDYDHDGNKDILVTGNFFDYRVQNGRADASFGLLLTGDGKGNFKPVEGLRSGLYARGNIRDMIGLDTGKLIVIAKNNDSLQVIKVVKFKHVPETRVYR